MEFYSKKLGKTINLGIAGGADDVLLIDSRSLWDFVDNDEDVRAKGFNVVIDTNVITSPDLSSVVIFGYAEDNEHTYSLECGEARTESLTDDISRAYPAKMALKRLKDVCAINWLELEGADGKRIYSSDEIPELRGKSATGKSANPTTASDDELAALMNATTADTPVALADFDKSLAELVNSSEPANEEFVAEAEPVAEIPEEAILTATDGEEIEKLLNKTVKIQKEKKSYKEIIEDEQLKNWFLNTQFKAGFYAKAKEDIIKILKARGEEI